VATAANPIRERPIRERPLGGIRERSVEEPPDTIARAKAAADAARTDPNLAMEPAVGFDERHPLVAKALDAVGPLLTKPISEQLGQGTISQFVEKTTLPAAQRRGETVEEREARAKTQGRVAGAVRDIAKTGAGFLDFLQTPAGLAATIASGVEPAAAPYLIAPFAAEALSGVPEDVRTLSRSAGSLIYPESEKALPSPSPEEVQAALLRPAMAAAMTRGVAEGPRAIRTARLAKGARLQAEAEAARSPQAPASELVAEPAPPGLEEPPVQEAPIPGKPAAISQRRFQSDWKEMLRREAGQPEFPVTAETLDTVRRALAEQEARRKGIPAVLPTAEAAPELERPPAPPVQPSQGQVRPPREAAPAPTEQPLAPTAVPAASEPPVKPLPPAQAAQPVPEPVKVAKAAIQGRPAEAPVLVRLSDLATDPQRFQPREGLSEGRVQWIGEQMAEKGYDPKEPLTVWRDPKDGRAYVIAGHHRLEAAGRTGIEEVPVNEFRGTEKEAMDYARRSNSQPVPLSPIAEAKAFAADVSDGRSTADIGKLYGGIKESTVTDRLALNNLPEALKGYVADGTFKLPLATALGKAAGKHKLSPEIQMEIFDNFIKVYDITPAKLSEAIDTLAPMAQQQLSLGLGFKMERGFTDALVEMMDTAGKVQSARRKFERTVREIAKMRKEGKEIPKNLVRAERALMAEAARLEKQVGEIQKRLGMGQEPTLKQALRERPVEQPAGPTEGRPRTAQSPTMQPAGAPPLELRPLEAPAPEVPPAEEAIFPGMEDVVERAKEALGRTQAEQMGEQMRTPVQQKGAAIEGSPLFRGTEAAPQKEMFGPVETAKRALNQPSQEQIEAKMESLRKSGLEADEDTAREAILREREEPSMFSVAGVPPPGMLRRAFPELAKDVEFLGQEAKGTLKRALSGLKARFAPAPKGPMAEAEARMGTTPEMQVVSEKIADFGTKLTEQAQLIADQMENIQETGTLQPKEVRTGIKHEGRPTPTRKVSEAMVKNVNAQLLVLHTEMSRIREMAKKSGTPRMVKLLSAAEESFKQFVEKEYKPTRRAAGRAVRAYQEPVPDAVVKKLRELGVAIKGAAEPGISDMIYEAWINALLSSPKTHLVNTTSNLLVKLSTPFERFAEGGIDFLRAKFTGTQQERFMGEAAADVYGTIAGWRNAVVDAAKAWKHETSMGHAKMEEAQTKAIPGKIGKAIRSPGRALVAEDDFFKALNYSAAKYAQAYRVAVKEGLTGQARSNRIAEIVKSEAGPEHEASIAEMFYRTFNQELGPVGKALQSVRSKSWPIRYIVPFMRTPLNIAKYGFERTPIELLHLLYKQSRAGTALKGGELSAAITKPLVGSMVGAAVVMLASEGKITGGGPSDPNEKRALYETGWQPYSVKVGDNYYSYGRLEPLGTVLGLSADYYETFDEKDEMTQRDLAGKISFSVTQNFLNKTFLRGISDVVMAVSDPERYGGKWLSGIMGTAVPNVLAEAARATDPYLRTATTVGESFKARIPGLSKELPPVRGVFGQPQEREGGFLRKFASPVQVSRVKGGEVEKELTRLGIAFGKPSKKMRIGDEEVDMTAQEYGEYQEVRGALAKEWLTNMLRDPYYKDTTNEEKKILIRGIFSEAGQQAREDIIAKREAGGTTAQIR